MKLRTALKLCRQFYEPLHPRTGKLRGMSANRTLPQFEKATRIGRSHWLDRRFPYIPSDDEQREKAELTYRILDDLAKSLQETPETWE